MGSFRTAGLDEEQQKGGWRDGSRAKSVDLSSALGTHTEGPPHLLYLQLQEIRYPLPLQAPVLPTPAHTPTQTQAPTHC